jgi:integrase/recombinase XerD
MTLNFSSEKFPSQSSGGLRPGLPLETGSQRAPVSSPSGNFGMKWVEARRDFLAWQEARGFSPSTLESRRIYLDEFIGFLRDRGVEGAEETTQAMMDDYRAWMLAHTSLWTGRKLSISSVSHRLMTVKMFFAELSRRKALLADPARSLTWPRKVVNPPRNVPTEKQMEEILARPDTGTAFGLRDRAILETLYATGIRREEAARLDLYDVNLAERTLCVRRGKGGQGRTVPLTASACAFLARYLKESRPELVRARGVRPAGSWAPTLRQTTPPPPSGQAVYRQELRAESALFVSIKGERFKKDRLGQLVGRYVRAVAPGSTMTCHAIRHAFATHMIQGGAHPAYVQRMLGHADFQTTALYTQLKPTELKAAHRRHHPRGRDRGVV